jgi:hypothetical protein
LKRSAAQQEQQGRQGQQGQQDQQDQLGSCLPGMVLVEMGGQNLAGVAHTAVTKRLQLLLVGCGMKAGRKKVTFSDLKADGRRGGGGRGEGGGGGVVDGGRGRGGRRGRRGGGSESTQQAHQQIELLLADRHVWRRHLQQKHQREERQQQSHQRRRLRVQQRRQKWLRQHGGQYEPNLASRPLDLPLFRQLLAVVQPERSPVQVAHMFRFMLTRIGSESTSADTSSRGAGGARAKRDKKRGDGGRSATTLRAAVTAVNVAQKQGEKRDKKRDEKRVKVQQEVTLQQFMVHLLDVLDFKRFTDSPDKDTDYFEERTSPDDGMLQQDLLRGDQRGLGGSQRQGSWARSSWIEYEETLAVLMAVIEGGWLDKLARLVLAAHACNILLADTFVGAYDGDSCGSRPLFAGCVIFFVVELLLKVFLIDGTSCSFIGCSANRGSYAVTYDARDQASTDHQTDKRLQMRAILSPATVAIARTIEVAVVGYAFVAVVLSYNEDHGINTNFQPFSTVNMHIALAQTLLFIRLVTLSASILRTLEGLMAVWREVFTFFASLLVVTYFYAAVGISTLQPVRTGGYNYGKNHSSADGDFPPDMGNMGQGAEMNSCDTFAHCFLMLFQFWTENDWNDILYPNVYQSADHGQQMLVAIYWSSYYAIINLVVVNILAALVLDAFTKLQAVADRQRYVDVGGGGGSRTGSRLSNGSKRYSSRLLNSRYKRLSMLFNNDSNSLSGRHSNGRHHVASHLASLRQSEERQVQGQVASEPSPQTSEMYSGPSSNSTGSSGSSMRSPLLSKRPASGGLMIRLQDIQGLAAPSIHGRMHLPIVDGNVTLLAAKYRQENTGIHHLSESQGGFSTGMKVQVPGCKPSGVDVLGQRLAGTQTGAFAGMQQQRSGARLQSAVGEVEVVRSNAAPPAAVPAAARPRVLSKASARLKAKADAVMAHWEAHRLEQRWQRRWETVGMAAEEVDVLEGLLNDIDSGTVGDACDEIPGDDAGDDAGDDDDSDLVSEASETNMFGSELASRLGGGIDGSVNLSSGGIDGSVKLSSGGIDGSGKLDGLAHSSVGRDDDSVASAEWQQERRERAAREEENEWAEWEEQYEREQIVWRQKKRLELAVSATDNERRQQLWLLDMLLGKLRAFVCSLVPLVVRWFGPSCCGNKGQHARLYVAVHGAHAGRDANEYSSQPASRADESPYTKMQLHTPHKVGPHHLRHDQPW